MTGNEIIKALKRIKGPVYGAIVALDEIYYSAIVKSDLVEVAGLHKNKDMGLSLRETCGAWYLERA